MTRYITLMDGVGMGDMVIVFKTNAPIDELKTLEKISNDGDVPIWGKVLTDKGYVFEYIDSHQHITPYGTSKEWLEEKYPQITEHYCIDNQP